MIEKKKAIVFDGSPFEDIKNSLSPSEIKELKKETAKALNISEEKVTEEEIRDFFDKQVQK